MSVTFIKRLTIHKKKKWNNKKRENK